MRVRRDAATVNKKERRKEVNYVHIIEFIIHLHAAGQIAQMHVVQMKWIFGQTINEIRKPTEYKNEN